MLLRGVHFSIISLSFILFAFVLVVKHFLASQQVIVLEPFDYFLFQEILFVVASKPVFFEVVSDDNLKRIFYKCLSLSLFFSDTQVFKASLDEFNCQQWDGHQRLYSSYLRTWLVSIVSQSGWCNLNPPINKLAPSQSVLLQFSLKQYHFIRIS